MVTVIRYITSFICNYYERMKVKRVPGVIPLILFLDFWKSQEGSEIANHVNADPAHMGSLHPVSSFTKFSSTAKTSAPDRQKN